MKPPTALILFDGVCNLCNASVNFIIDHDPERYFRFASLQSDISQSVMKEHGLTPNDLSSIVLIEDGKVYRRSTAALRIARRLSHGWWLLYPLRFIPLPIRDAVYQWIADHRYHWFGRSESCRLPTPDQQSRFL